MGELLLQLLERERERCCVCVCEVVVFFWQSMGIHCTSRARPLREASAFLSHESIVSLP